MVRGAPLSALTIIQRNMCLPYLSEPLEQRFLYAMSLHEFLTTAESFLQALGLTAVDPSIAKLVDANGETILHFAAIVLGQQYTRSDMMQWRDFIIELIRAEATLHHINDRGRTPLLAFIRYSKDNVVFEGQSRLQFWAETLQLAGVDLLDYGTTETDTWRDVNVSEQSQHDYPEIRPVGFSYSAKPTDWVLRVRILRVVTVWELGNLPGAWPSSVMVPRRICWYPGTKEEAEGSWHEVASIDILSDVQDIERLPRNVHESGELVKGTQDDAAMVALLVTNPRKLLHRSKSCPFMIIHD